LWPLLGLCMHTPFQTLVVGVQCTLCGFRFSLFSTTILKGQLQPVVNMCRMPVGMVVKPPHSRWLFTYLKRIISSSSAVGFALCVYWGLPFVWLSLLLERLIAPKQEPMWFRFCWQFSFFQIVRDEVKGKKPFVYEDMLSETSIASLLDLSRDICMFVWCLGTDSWPYYSWQPRRAESRLDVCIRVCDATDSMVVPFTLVPCCSVGMYYSLKLVFSFFFHLEFPVMFVVERLQCIRGNAVSRTDGCCIHSVISCNVSIFRDLEQHLCVLGLCCKALDVHPWMLGPAHHGLCLNRCFGMCLLALELHRRMLELAHRGLGPNKSIVTIFANRLRPLLCLRTLTCLMRLRLRHHRTIVTFVSK